MIFSNIAEGSYMFVQHPQIEQCLLQCLINTDLSKALLLKYIWLGKFLSGAIAELWEYMVTWDWASQILRYSENGLAPVLLAGDEKH